MLNIPDDKSFQIQTETAETVRKSVEAIIDWARENPVMFNRFASQIFTYLSNIILEGVEKKKIYFQLTSSFYNFLFSNNYEQQWKSLNQQVSCAYTPILHYHITYKMYQHILHTFKKTNTQDCNDIDAVELINKVP